jgi:hypothetical protein
MSRAFSCKPLALACPIQVVPVLPKWHRAQRTIPNSPDASYLVAAEGFADLGLWLDANAELDRIQPDLPGCQRGIRSQTR